METIVITLNGIMDKLTDKQKEYLEKNRKKFEEYMIEINKSSIMDINMHIKTLYGKKRKAIINMYDADANIMFIDKMVDADLESKGYGGTKLKDHMLRLSNNPNAEKSRREMSKFIDVTKLQIMEIDIDLAICEYINSIKKEYTGDKNEIELLILKLENDIEMLKQSSDINAAKQIANVEKAIELISTLPDSFLINGIHTDKRAKKLVKEYDPKLISKVFGSNEFIGDFVMRLYTDSELEWMIVKSNTAQRDVDATNLFLFAIAKKIDVSMKAKDYMSLVYRSFIITYVSLTEAKSPAARHMAKLFNDIICKFVENNICHYYSDYSHNITSL